MDQTTPRANFYLDQNILGHLAEGRFRIPADLPINWIYSSEHFEEMSRGKADDYLTALQRIQACQIRFR